MAYRQKHPYITQIFLILKFNLAKEGIMSTDELVQEYPDGLRL